MVGLPLWNIPRNHGWIAFPPYPLAQIAAASSARLRTILTLERAHTRPYTILRQAVKSPSDAGWLRSSPVGFAEPFRSVCRNVSGKLPSHPFAALTGLRGCAAGRLVSNIMQHPQVTNINLYQIFFRR